MIETIDSDFWGQQATLRLIAPYLDEGWREYLRLREDGTFFSSPVTRELPESVFWRPGRALLEAAVDDNPVACAREALGLDHVAHAILNPGVAGPLSALASPYYASQVARAVNEWTLRDWLDADERFLGSIVVALTDAKLAASEIERAARDSRMVQILVAYPRRLLGHRSHRPVFEVASECGLPLTLQAGGAFTGANRGIAPVGHPTSAFEYDLEWFSAAQPHLISMICEGVFDRHPKLKLVLNGFGIAWLPALLWQMDEEFRSRRLSIPRTVSRLPSEYVREHVRFTTSALEMPDRPGDLATLLRFVDGERLLLYGSGPNRGHPGRAVAQSDALSWCDRLVFQENARDLYGEQLKLSTEPSARPVASGPTALEGGLDAHRR